MPTYSSCRSLASNECDYGNAASSFRRRTIAPGQGQALTAFEEAVPFHELYHLRPVLLVGIKNLEAKTTVQSLKADSTEDGTAGREKRNKKFEEP
jgi:hypothetical protein